jgi:aminopeptidase
VSDPRVEQYAKLLVETCIDVQPGWQVMVSGGILARPLLEEVSRAVARRGAYALLRPSLSGYGNIPWLQEAPEDLLDTPPALDSTLWETIDGLVSIEAPENTRELAAVPSERLQRYQRGLRPHQQRIFSHELKWVGCQYPTTALAQDADMPLEAFSDFLYGACLLDWEAERTRMTRYAEQFEAAEEVRIVSNGSDRSTRAGRTCPAGSSSPHRSRTRPRARSFSASSRRSTPAARCAGSGFASRAARSSTPQRR